jgi:CheY-like chemotaxis protein
MRGAELTQRLLAFARRQVLAPQVVELNGRLSNMIELLRRTLGEAVEIKTIFADDLWPAKVDPVQLESAVLNLAINARDAMPGGGRLVIETSNQTLSEHYAAHHAEVSAGPYAMLAISDTGAGMPPEVLEHALEPFFTTKEVGKGTGLGLSMVYGFVKQSGGHMSIYSEEGHGTTVKLYFPRAEPADRPSAVAAVPEDQRPTGHETILVVEDDGFVRETAISLLEEFGYRVLQATDGPSALAMLERDPEVDLLFTDVVMPEGMNGVALAREVTKRWPRIKVLYTSGYTENAIVHGGKLNDGVEWIGKPYFKGDLSRKIRHVLDAPPRAPARGDSA